MDIAKYAFVEGILAGVGITFIVIEVVLNLNDTKDDTTNVLLYQWSKKQFIFIPFVLGAIGGHLFLGSTNPIWPAFYETLDGMLTVLVLFLVSLLFLAIGALFSFRRTKAFLTLMLFLGLFYGHYFWSMNIGN